MVLKSSIRKGWRTGFWARATCWRSLNRRNAASTTRRRNSGFAKSKKGALFRSEVFHPEGMANRILGQGDLLALAEQAQRGIDDAQAKQWVRKIKKGGAFDLDDFQAQLMQMKKMGGMAALLEKLPAQFQPASGQSNLDQAEKQMRRMSGIIHS